MNTGSTRIQRVLLHLACILKHLAGIIREFPMTPITKLTYRVSIAATVAAIGCIVLGQFVIASILGTTAACNLIAGVALKKY